MEIRSNRPCTRVCNFVSTCLILSAISFSICEARLSPRKLTDKAPSTHRSSFFLITAAKLNLVKYLNADTSTNSGSYGVGSPFNLPPYDSLAPIPLPQNAPPYCINPPNGPQTPSVTIPSPIGNTPSSPPFYNFPPTLPSQNPPPSPSGGISGPSGPGFSPNPTPPGSFVPSPSSGIPSPSSEIPSPSSGIPSPSGEIPSPSSGIPSPSSGIPSPSVPGFSPSPNPPGPFVPSPSSPGFSPNPNPPSSFVPSPPESVPSPASPGSESPPYYEPSPPYYEPSPPYLVPNPPSYVPSPFGRVPSPRAFHPPVVYPPPQGPPPRGTTPIMVLWCVAKPTVPDPIILEAMNYACGSGADCDSIQPYGSCYEPNSLLAHASFAFNSYWQRTKAAGGTCEFGGTAILVSVDPSSGGCHYTSY